MYFGAANNFGYSDPAQLISADPLLANPPHFDVTVLGQYAFAPSASLLGKDLSLRAASPAIGRGIDPSVLPDLPAAIVSDLKKCIYQDIEGCTRPEKGRWDLGAYQSGCSH
jgi:hypothetical protein